MNKQEEIIIAGFGGQGILFMGTLLAQAAMESGLQVTFFPSYGAEMRGGTANCTVIISNEQVGSPVSETPDTVIAMNQPSLNRFVGWIKKGGLLVINSSLINNVTEMPDLIDTVGIPATEIAQKLGNEQCTNMVALGSYLARKQIVSLDAAVKGLPVVLGQKKLKLLDVNISALKHGYNSMKEKG
jgi:2-oxoglutarate ferredoxin oxidoreductase subunit gamma